MENKLHIFNEKIYEKCNLLKNKDELACPLLVSSNNQYLEKINESKQKILYIGQETNGWVNYDDNNEFMVNEIEKVYYDFMMKSDYNKPFWQFIKSIIGPDNKVFDNIIWNNIFITGKRSEIGPPSNYNEIGEISLEYLLFLYEYFNPKNVILVSGPNNPYYDITIKFLKEIKSNIKTYPTVNNNMLIDYEKNIFWTYHPNYQNRKNFINDNEEKIKKIILTKC